MPQEISFGEVFMPPTLIVMAIALLLAWLTAVLLNKTRWSRFFYSPTLVFLSMVAIYSVLLGTFVVQF